MLQVAELRRKIDQQNSAERMKELRQKNMAVEKLTSEISNFDAMIKSKAKASE